MKKKLYDFSPFNAVVAILAYGFLITLGFFFIFTYDDGINWLGIVFTLLLLVSFGMIFWYFVVLAVTITDKQIQQGKKVILKKNARMTVDYNARFRQREITFRDRTIDYDHLSKNEITRRQIVVQYFLKNEDFLNHYLGLPREKEKAPDEKEK